MGWQELEPNCCAFLKPWRAKGKVPCVDFHILDTAGGGTLSVRAHAHSRSHSKWIPSFPLYIPVLSAAVFAAPNDL